MRIAVWHNLPSGGGKRALYHHLRGLHQRGHHLDIWCPSTADETYLPLREFGNVNVLPLPTPRLRRPLTALGSSRAALRYVEALLTIHRAHAETCARAIEQGGYDLVFANSCMHFSASYLGSRVPLPSVLYLQEPYRSLYEARPTLPWAALPPAVTWTYSPKYLRWILENLLETQALRVQVREERTMAQGYTRILVNSLFSKESLLRAYGLEPRVCYLGIDAALFRPLHLERENLVVSVGSFIPSKGLDRAVRAVARIPASRRPRLLWIGNMKDESYARSMRQLADERQVTLELKSMVPDEELVSWLNRASVFLYTARLEPFGFAPLEANACETPAVAIAEGGVRESIRDGENGLLVNGDEPDSLAAAMDRLLGDPSYARNLGRTARELVMERWTWEKAVDRLEQEFHVVRSEAK